MRIVVCIVGDNDSVGVPIIIRIVLHPTRALQRVCYCFLHANAKPTKIRLVGAVGNHDPIDKQFSTDAQNRAPPATAQPSHFASVAKREDLF